MAKNLSVTTYRYGNPIPQVIRNDQWRHELFWQRSGAYSNYSNGASIAEVYGRLYNWYAVTDLRGICPADWRVPTDEDWKKLERELGMSTFQINETRYRGNVGSKLKVTGTEFWLHSNTGATNESRFSALPGGSRSLSTGEFFELRRSAAWWSSTSGIQTMCMRLHESWITTKPVSL